MKPNTVLFLFPDGARIAFDRLPEPIKLADGLIVSWIASIERTDRPHYQYRRKVACRPSPTQAARLLEDADDLYKRQYPDDAGERVE